MITQIKHPTIRTIPNNKSTTLVIIIEIVQLSLTTDFLGSVLAGAFLRLCRTILHISEVQLEKSSSSSNQSLLVSSFLFVSLFSMLDNLRFFI
jgi:hypothetical protein